MTKSFSKRAVVLICFVYSFSSHLFAQAVATDSLQNKLSISLEIRPRAEYTSNYVLPPNDSISPFLFITQRARLTANYERKWWALRSDFQEIHYWDKNNVASKVGSVNFYQLYVDTKFKTINIRLGRQGVLLDNGRIFSDAPWAQQGRAHEGIRLSNTTGNANSYFYALFTRKYADHFEPTFSPVAAHRYKQLYIHHLTYNANENFSFNTINAVDIFKDQRSGKSISRITSGGRIELKKDRYYYTLNSYVQYGKTPQGKKLVAYYLQPEFRLSLPKATFRLGAELISGSNPNATRTGDFDVLYGVAWKFMGNMNIFTRFPADVAGKGLVNPYLFILLPVNNNLSLRSDFHLFYTQYPLINGAGQRQNRFIGFENDFSLRYRLLKKIDVNYGFSFMKSAPAMQYLPKIQDASKLTVWSYLMASYTLDVLHKKW